MIATLEAEATRLGSELAEADAEAEPPWPRSRTSSRRPQAALAEARAGFEREWADGVPAPTGGRPRCAASSPRCARASSAASRSSAAPRARLATLQEKLERLEAEADRLRAEAEAAEAAEGPLVERLAGAEQQRADRRAAGRRGRGGAAGRRRRPPRLDGPGRGAEPRPRPGPLAAGAERLAVRRRRGRHAARPRRGRRRLGGRGRGGRRRGPRRGRGRRRGRRSRRASTPSTRRATTPSRRRARARRAPAARRRRRRSASRVRRHVRARRADVEPLLDALLGGAVVVDGGWPAAVDAALAHPDAVVVTRDGDRFGATGWRVGHRVHRCHRRRARGGARSGPTRPPSPRNHAEASLHGARSLLDEARQAEAAARPSARRARRPAHRGHRRPPAGRGRPPRRRRPRPRRSRATSTSWTSGSAASRPASAELELTLPLLEAEEADTAERAQAMADAKAHLEERAAAVGSLRADLEVALGRARPSAASSCASRLDRGRGAARGRRWRPAARPRSVGSSSTPSRAPSTAWPPSSADRLATVESRARSSSASAAAARARPSGPPPPGSTTCATSGPTPSGAWRRPRERPARAELDEAEVKLRLEAAVEALRRDLDVEPDVAMAAEPPELPEGATPTARARELERELRLMGPINPLALEEFEALQERHAFLQEQLDDVKASRRELAKVIRAIDAEIVDVFAGAFADVSQNFEPLFETLFPGGQGRLRLTDARRPARDRHRGRGQAVGQERPQALAALRWRALAHRAGLPVRRVPQPPVALLRDGRGRGRPRRRQPPPLPRPGARVPPGGAAAHREPPEAHDGGRRRASTA